MAAVESMRIKSRLATTGDTRTKTFSPLAFANGTTQAQAIQAVKYMAQRLVALTTNTYGETDFIKTWNVDTEEVINVG